MNKTLKNGVGAAVIVGILAVAYASIRYVAEYGQSLDPSRVRSFSVSGEGKAIVVPDVALATIGVVSEGDEELKTLQDKNTEKMNAVIAFIKGKGVKEKDIETSEYAVSPRYEGTVCGEKGGVTVCSPPRISGYTVSQKVTVKIRDFDIIGEIIGGVVGEGANTVSGVSFTLDEPEKAEREAREKAIKQAERKAKEIAKDAGFRVGKILSINEGGFYPWVSKQASVFYGPEAALDARAVPAIEPGSEEVRITVNIQYEIR